MKKYNVKLNINDIRGLVKELNQYKDSLNTKAERFVRRLSEQGITVAQSFTEVAIDDKGSLGYLITFETQVEHIGNVTMGYMVGKNKAPFVSEWLVYDAESKTETIKTAEVSPLLMYEFGSGLYAEAGEKKQGLHYPSFASNPRGSFPNQTHAFDDNGWWFKDLDGTWYHSYGSVATQPMLNAWEHMNKNIKKVAKEVFRED